MKTITIILIALLVASVTTAQLTRPMSEVPEINKQYQSKFKLAVFDGIDTVGKQIVYNYLVPAEPGDFRYSNGQTGLQVRYFDNNKDGLLDKVVLIGHFDELYSVYKQVYNLSDDYYKTEVTGSSYIIMKEKGCKAVLSKSHGNVWTVEIEKD
jgi:hypothetical protein